MMDEVALSSTASAMQESFAPKGEDLSERYIWQLIINPGATIVTFLMVFPNFRSATAQLFKSSWMRSSV
jgi:hypothetical protein